MSPSKSKSTPQFVTLQVACDKSFSVEKPTARMTSVTELALVILGVGAGLTLAATTAAFHARGELGFGLPKAFSGLGKIGNTLPMSGFLFGSSTDARPDSIFSSEPQDLHSPEPEPLLVALASPGNSIATVIRHGLSGSKPTRKKGLLSWGAAYAQAAPPEKLSKPPDIAPPVTTMYPTVASDRSAVQGLAALAPPPALAAVEELQNWFGKGQPSFGQFGDLRAWCLVKQAFMILFVVLTFVGLSLGLKAAVRKGKSSKPALEVEADNALVESSEEGLHSEDDIMEAFDGFDRKRMGFIDRATVNHMLGHMALPGHLDAAAPFLGSVKKLFYDDFRRLAQQPGPFADIITERVNRRQKRMESAKKREHAFDERCSFGLDVDAAQAAMSALSQSQATPPPAPSNTASAPGGRRSWAELRADLAPKPSTN